MTFLRDPAVSPEIRGLFNREMCELQALANRVFAYLFACQWVFAIGCALVVSPLTWTGAESSTHVHVLAAVLLGGLLASLPIYLMRVAPYRTVTRMTTASAQVMFSALLIHLMGGRIEAHFHVFGSLALLSFYRDPWVFLPAVALTFIDHLIRGVFWPESVFGVFTPSVWRAFEHAAWVVFETAFLLWGVAQGRGHLLKMATLQASLTSEKDGLDARVQERTRELAAARDYFQNILDSLESHICILDREGTILSTNLAWRRFGEQRGGEASDSGPGANYLEACRNTDGECREGALAVADAIESVIDGHAENSSLVYACHGPNDKNWFALRVSRFVDDEDAAVVVAHSNVTDRVLATEASQRESQHAAALARVILESPNEVYVFDQDSLRFVEANDGACASSGYEREELLSMTPVGLKPEFDEATFREKIAPLAEGETPVLEFQTDHLRKDGSRYPAQISLHKASLGGLAVYVAFVTDLTSVRRLERQLSQTQKLDSLGQLSAGIAHEINTPMQCVASNIDFMNTSLSSFMRMLRSFWEQLESPAKSWEQRREEAEAFLRESRFDYLTKEIPAALDDANTATKRVVEIVRAMRAMSHPGTEEMAPVDVNELIRNASTISRNRWKHAAELRLDLSENLPETLGYGGELSQVFLNLLVNAADAIAEKNAGACELGVITVRTSASDEFLRVEVEDTGVGMPASVRERAFDPFFTTKEVGKGTGQGLSIAHNVVVNQHGGTIDVVSTQGEGTTFLLGLPTADAQREKEDAAAAVAN